MPSSGLHMHTFADTGIKVIFFQTVSHYKTLAGLEQCVRFGWPQTQKSVSASQLLTLKTCTTMPDSNDLREGRSLLPDCKLHN